MEKPDSDDVQGHEKTSGPSGQAGPEFQSPQNQGLCYVVDPMTGQLFYKVPVGPHAFSYGREPGAPPCGFRSGHGPSCAQPGPFPYPGAAPAADPNAQGPDPGAYAQSAYASPCPDYGELIKSVEKFAEGEASVGDVVKSLYTSTAQDDQFWKGALMGAVAAVLLTSGPVKAAMGKTLGGLFGKGGAEQGAAAEAPSSEKEA